MASSKVSAHNIGGEWHPDKIVIVTAPTFKTVFGLIGLGVVLGAAGALYWQSRQSGSTLDDGALDSLTEGSLNLGTTDAAGADAIVRRLNRLANRAKALANRAKATVQTASEVLGPALNEAIAEGRQAARETEQNLKKDLENDEIAPATRPNIAADPA